MKIPPGNWVLHPNANEQMQQKFRSVTILRPVWTSPNGYLEQEMLIIDFTMKSIKTIKTFEKIKSA